MAEGEGEGAAERCALERETEMGGPQFSPPLYRQRYEAVVAACRRLQAAKVASWPATWRPWPLLYGQSFHVHALCSTTPRKVLDMGCAECRLLQLLSREKCVRELVGVDVQASLLEAHQHRLRPLTTDFILRREQPLTVQLMQGAHSVVGWAVDDTPLPDPRLDSRGGPASGGL